MNGKVLFHAGNGLSGLRQFAVDLAARRERRHAVAHQFAQALPFQAQQLSHQQPRDHPAVAVGKITEIVVGAHLAAVDGVFLTHTLFDKRVAGFGHHRLAARGLHHVDGVPGKTRIVNDFRPRVFLEERFRQQANDVVAFDKLPFLVEQEAAVEIAVKGDTHIGAVLNHRVAGVVAALRQQRVRNTVREVAVRRVVHFDEGHRHVQCLKAGFKCIDNRACRAVAGVNHQLQRFEVRHVDVAQQVVDVLFLQVNLLIAAASGFIHRREVVGLGQTLHVAQAGVAADRTRALAHQLHAVVVHRIMTGRHFDTAVHAQVEGGKIDLFGTGKTNVQHVDARVL
ncbi:Uncharacterised protein [Enterobacter hormaechei]|nr:Uncharacterised protein [Enterobacter hormaechei]SAD33439.1 Uncharacterised protein [Enterobacter hormaechei]